MTFDWHDNEKKMLKVVSEVHRDGEGLKPASTMRRPFR